MEFQDIPQPEMTKTDNIIVDRNTSWDSLSLGSTIVLCAVNHDIT